MLGEHRQGPSGVKWVDASNGVKENLEYRCRLVAKEIKKDKREDLFGAMPPLEAKKTSLSLWASMPGMFGLPRRGSCLHSCAGKEKSLLGAVDGGLRSGLAWTAEESHARGPRRSTKFRDGARGDDG